MENMKAKCLLVLNNWWKWLRFPIRKCYKQIHAVSIKRLSVKMDRNVPISTYLHRYIKLPRFHHGLMQHFLNFYRKGHGPAY